MTMGLRSNHPSFDEDSSLCLHGVGCGCRRRISAGQEWAGQISEHLEKVGIILGLVSAGFLESLYSSDKVLSRALEHHAAGDVCVIPVIARGKPYPDATT